MNTFPRRAKNTPGAYYFGDFDQVPLAPFSISLATFDEAYAGEKPHYHTQNQKAFLTLEGEGVLNVNGVDVVMHPEELIHVEPKDIHFVSRVTKSPLKFIVIASSKINDKVIVED